MLTDHHRVEVACVVADLRPRFRGEELGQNRTQVVELGVVNATIHKINESVRLEDIDVLHKLYYGVLRNLLG
jgi:hypothetical protein